MFKFKKVSKPFLGFLQASGLVAYILIISIFLNNIENIFHKNIGEYMAPIIMLLLFIISAVISSILVLGKVGILFWEKKYSKAFTILAWTIGWGIFYLILLLTTLFISNLYCS
jgi:hypothetical protein